MAADEKFTALNRDLHKYLLDHGHNRDPLLAELAARPPSSDASPGCRSRPNRAP